MQLSAYIPFFYFQTTRLNNFKAWLFHLTFEWLPALALVIYYVRDPDSVFQLALYYFAFISLYEIGYLANDQLAHNSENERKRVELLSAGHIGIFVGIRFIVFILITNFQGHLTSHMWWAWFFLLGIQFTAHNLLKLGSLKIITFCYLAFARFLSPVVFLLPTNVLQVILIPVILNYVIFRLIIYMDSKGMLLGFERKSFRFLLGYYVLLAPFSVYTSLIYSSFLPVAINAFYMLVVISVGIKWQKASHQN